MQDSAALQREIKNFHMALREMPSDVFNGLQFGTVVSEEMDGTCTVILAGDDEETNGIRKMQVPIQPGAVCVLMPNGDDWIVIGCEDSGNDWVPFTPTFNNVTLGTGGTTFGYYRRNGNHVEFKAGFTLGTSGAVTGSVSMEGPFTILAVVYTVGAARMRDDSAGFSYSGVATTPGTNTTRWVNNVAYSGTTGANVNTPFTWAVNDSMLIAGSVILA